jgi:3',5'-cyclic AMP phosphodiesterase CpdA
MKLWAMSDVHVGHAENRRLVADLPACPDDWLVLGGDIGETLDELRFVLQTLSPRFRRLVWVPGNHDLWTTVAGSPRGEAKYRALVTLCRAYGVLTPEDPYELFNDGTSSYLIAPTFTLYDYSFCPDGMPPQAARTWALQSGIECADEYLLHPDPYASREDWCAARCALTEERLTQALATNDLPTVLVGHFPLRAELANLPFVPRFSIWCGTRRTADWHRRFRAAAVVFGHLHIPQTRVIDGVRFEEVSLGYPRQWNRRLGGPTCPRQILPVTGGARMQ